MGLEYISELSLLSQEAIVRCILCNGYIIDCTRISECNHIFCRSCIVLYLRNSKRCPHCRTNLGYEPLTQLQADEHQQSLIYKLVPNLAEREEERRRNFWNEYRNTEGSQEIHQEIITRDLNFADGCMKLFRKFKIQICLEYFKTSVLKLESDSLWREIDCNIAKTFVHVLNTTPLRTLRQFVSLKMEKKYDPKFLQVMFVLPENNRPLRHDLLVHEIPSIMFHTIWDEPPKLRFAVFMKVADYDYIQTKCLYKINIQSKISKLEGSKIKQTCELIEISSDENEDIVRPSSAASANVSCIDGDIVGVDDDKDDAVYSIVSTSTSKEMESDKPHIKMHLKMSKLAEKIPTTELTSSLSTDDESSSPNLFPNIFMKYNILHEMMAEPVENYNTESNQKHRKQSTGGLLTETAKAKQSPAPTTKTHPYPNLKRAFSDLEMAPIAKVSKREIDEQPIPDTISRCNANKNQIRNGHAWREIWTANKKRKLEPSAEKLTYNCSPAHDLPSTSSVRTQSDENISNVEERSIAVLRTNFLNLIKSRESTSTAKADIGEVVRELTSLAKLDQRYKTQSPDHAVMRGTHSTPPRVNPTSPFPGVTKPCHVNAEDNQVTVTTVKEVDKQTPQSSGAISVPNTANEPWNICGRTTDMDMGELPVLMVSNAVEDIPNKSPFSSIYNSDTTNNVTKHKLRMHFMPFDSIVQKRSDPHQKQDEVDTIGKTNSGIQNDTSSSTEVIIDFDDDKQSLPVVSNGNTPQSFIRSGLSSNPVISNRAVRRAVRNNNTRQRNNTKHTSLTLSPGKTRLHVRNTVSTRAKLKEGDQSIRNGRITRSGRSVKSNHLTSAFKWNSPRTRSRIVLNRSSNLSKQSSTTANIMTHNQSSTSTSTMHLSSKPTAALISELSSITATTMISKQSTTVASSMLSKQYSTSSNTLLSKQTTASCNTVVPKQSTTTASTMLSEHSVAIALVPDQYSPTASAVVPKQSSPTVSTAVPEQITTPDSTMLSKQSSPTASTVLPKQSSPTANTVVPKQITFSDSTMLSKQSTPTASTVVPKQSSPTVSTAVPKQITTSDSNMLSKQSSPTASTVVPKQSSPNVSIVVPKQITTSDSTMISKQSSPTVSTAVPEQSSSTVSTVLPKQITTSASTILSKQSFTTGITTAKTKMLKQSASITTMARSFYIVAPPVVTVTKKNIADNHVRKQNVPQRHDIANCSRKSDTPTVNLHVGINPAGDANVPIADVYRVSERRCFRRVQNTSTSSTYQNIRPANGNTAVSRNSNHVSFNVKDSAFLTNHQHKDVRRSTGPRFELPETLTVMNEVRNLKQKLNHLQSVDIARKQDLPEERDEQINVLGERGYSSSVYVDIDDDEYYDDEHDETLKKEMDDDIKITSVYSKKEKQTEENIIPAEIFFQPFIDRKHVTEMCIMDVDDLSNMNIVGDHYLGRQF